MSLSMIGTRDPASLPPNATVAEAVALMKSRNVGSIVVIDEEHKPVGILTDRDIVMRLVTHQNDPGAVTVRMIMSGELVTMPDAGDIEEAAWKMREHAVRRLPITGPEGALLGIVTLDDIIGHISSNRSDVSEIISSFFAPYQAV